MDLDLAGDAGSCELAGLGVTHTDLGLRRHRPAAALDAIGEAITRACDREQRLHLARTVEAVQRHAARLGLRGELAPAGLECGKAADFEMRKRTRRVGEG